jgi:hypothetical protein
MEAGRERRRRALTVAGDLAEAPAVGAAARGGVGVRRHRAPPASRCARVRGPRSPKTRRGGGSDGGRERRIALARAACVNGEEEQEERFFLLRRGVGDREGGYLCCFQNPTGTASGKDPGGMLGAAWGFGWAYGAWSRSGLCRSGSTRHCAWFGPTRVAKARGVRTRRFHFHG